jgi:hypothetical protein
MVFTVSGAGASTSTVNPIAEFFADSEATGGNPPVSAESNAELAYPGDNQLIVTGVAYGVAPSTIAALITSNLTLPAGKRWTIAYATLNAGACTATAI